MKQDINELLIKYRNGSITKTEMDLLETWYLKWTPEEEEITLERLNKLEEEVYRLLPRPVKQVKLWPRIAVVAAAVVVIISGLYLFRAARRPVPRSFRTAERGLMNDIGPGKQGATLTLANGKKIVLANISNKELAKETGMKLSKTAEGTLTYTVYPSLAGLERSDAYHTLSTARGETYLIGLPDGSKVWLNAGSSLKYPASFVNRDKRIVVLTGEAYFEIAKDKSHPFVVIGGNQKVEVLGTHFNVNAYADEPNTKTTLLEGSVRISLPRENPTEQRSSAVLKPNQQSIVSGTNRINVKDVDVASAVAWKNNEFMFTSESIENIMKMLSRWYNVEIIYQGEKCTEKYSGSVSRFDNVSKVLEILESSGGVHFKIEGRKIYLSR